MLNTHCHLDHVFGNKFVHDTYGLSLYIHKNEKTVLDFASVSGDMWGLPFDNYDGELFFLSEGDHINIGKDSLTVLFTPGHSPGSIAYFCKAQQFILSGDVLFKESIGRTDLPGGNYATLIDSIRKKLWNLPDEVIVHSGHGPDTSIGYEKLYNPFLNQAGSKIFSDNR